MSQLKKQAVVGRKPVRRASAVSSFTTKPKTGALWRTPLQVCRTALKWIAFPVWRLLRRWPKTMLIVSIGASLTAVAGYGLFRAVKTLSNTLPQNVKFNSPRPELQPPISAIVADTMRAAHQEEWTRIALTDKLVSRISMVDGVDEVSIRSGLDGKMFINIVAQAPLLVLEGKDGERILIGSKFKIIARGLSADAHPHLPQVVAPDLNLNIRVAREKKRTQTGLFFKPSSFSGINVRWLSQQALKIKSHFETEKIPLYVEKIIYRNGTGFSAFVRHQEAPSQETSEVVVAIPSSGHGVAPTVTTQEVQKFTIILGENEFQEKFARLQQIIQDLRIKRTPVEQIDLAFSDKAIIRMSEQLSDAKKGVSQ